MDTVRLPTKKDAPYELRVFSFNSLSIKPRISQHLQGHNT